MPSLPSPRQSSLASDSLCQEESVIYYDNNSIIPHLCVGVLRVLKVCSPRYAAAFHAVRWMRWGQRKN